MTTLILNKNLTPDELDWLYGPADYYWYLKSPQFRDTFLQPLGGIIDSCNKASQQCLDVGCGEGWLSEYIAGPYIGVDGSRVGVEHAREKYPRRQFFLGRMEHPQRHWGKLNVVVFGGIFSVLVKPECQVELLDRYWEMFNPSYFVIYDLQQLDTNLIQQHFPIVQSFKASVDMPSLQEIKRHRKIEVYSCR